jgi:hypothetical protein
MIWESGWKANHKRACLIMVSPVPVGTVGNNGKVNNGKVALSHSLQRQSDQENSNLTRSKRVLEEGQQ